MHPVLWDDDAVVVSGPAEAPYGDGRKRAACRGEEPAHGDERLIELVRLVFLAPSRSGELVRSAAFAGIENHGSTTIAAEVAEWLASHLRRTVCLVDARCASPSLHTRYQIANDAGLSDALLTRKPIEHYVRAVPRGTHPALWLITAGRANQRNDPSRMIAGASHRLRELMQTFDFVLINAPDVTQRGATALCATVDRVVLVADARTTTRAAARCATERLRASGARVCGGVLID